MDEWRGRRAFPRQNPLSYKQAEDSEILPLDEAAIKLKRRKKTLRKMIREGTIESTGDPKDPLEDCFVKVPLGDDARAAGLEAERSAKARAQEYLERYVRELSEPLGLEKWQFIFEYDAPGVRDLKLMFLGGIEGAIWKVGTNFYFRPEDIQRKLIMRCFISCLFAGTEPSAQLLSKRFEPQSYEARLMAHLIMLQSTGIDTVAALLANLVDLPSEYFPPLEPAAEQDEPTL